MTQEQGVAMSSSQKPLDAKQEELSCDRCDAVSNAKPYTKDWQYPGIMQSSINLSDKKRHTKSCKDIAGSASKSRVAVSPHKADTLYYLVDDTTDDLHRLSTLKLENGEWSYMGGYRHLKYDQSVWNEKRDVQVVEGGEGDQKFDIQARSDEVCIVWTDRTNILSPSGKMTPLVYCFNESEQSWKEMGSTSRIGHDSTVGDVELVLPSTCDCPELTDYYFVIVGRPASIHEGGQSLESRAVVWFYNRKQPELGWLPLGGKSNNTSVIQGISRDAHLAIPGAGTFKCIPHAVVSDDDNIDGGVFDDAKHLVFARFEPGVATPDDMAGFMTGSWLALDQLNQHGAWDNKHAQHVKENVNDFVFTSTGVPAVAWADGANQNHVYLSVWSGYSTAGSNDLNGFVVAGSNTINRGAICPSGGVICTTPSYEDPTGLSVDSNGDFVFVAITSAAKKKIYIEYIDVSQTNILNAQWQDYESKDHGLLPRQPDGMCGDVDMDYISAAPTAQSQIKLNCQGEVYVAHVVERRDSMSTAAIAKNGMPVHFEHSSEGNPTAVAIEKKDEATPSSDEHLLQDSENGGSADGVSADEDGSFYCRAIEHPCRDDEGDGMVHVCHYSARLGYQTFCIPEADSEVLRFYNKDYCGPCVGGFGGVNKGSFA